MTSRFGRPGTPSVVQYGLDAIGALLEPLFSKINAVADPRARLLRRRRRALRWGLIFAAACLFWVGLTAVLAAWGWFVLLLVGTGAVAVLLAFPATLLLFRYRWLRSVPLPTARPVGSNRLPPHGSAARPAMYALGASERGFYSLLGVIESGDILPADEISGLSAAAKETSTAMAATAAEVVAMERVARESASSRDHLVPTINAFTTALSAGVRQYNEMVTAAAQLVSTASGSAALDSGSRQRYQAELTEATTRLLSWAHAFEELRELPAAST